MKLKCTIGSQGFVGGPTYRKGDEYELEDEELAKQIIKWGDAEEVKEVPSSILLPPVTKAAVDLEEISPIEEKPLKRTKSRKKY